MIEATFPLLGTAFVVLIVLPTFALLAKAGLVRKPGETLTRFAARVAADAGDPEAAAWYADYAAVRYGGADPESCVSLKDRLRTLGP